MSRAAFLALAARAAERVLAGFDPSNRGYAK
jgi:hypothetical protein